MTARRAALLCVLLAALLVWGAPHPTPPAVAAPVPKALKAKAANFDGKWELVRQNNSNKEVAQISPWIWEIDGETLTLHWGNGDGTFRKSKFASAFVRPADAQSDEMDYVYNPTNGGKPSLGRATVEAYEFVVCWAEGGNPRPGDITPGPGVNYYRFKRLVEK